MSEQQVGDRPKRVIEPAEQAHPLHVAAVFDQQADPIGAVHHHGERQQLAAVPGHLGAAVEQQPHALAVSAAHGMGEQRDLRRAPPTGRRPKARWPALRDAETLRAAKCSS